MANFATTAAAAAFGAAAESVTKKARKAVAHYVNERFFVEAELWFGKWIVEVFQNRKAAHGLLQLGFVPFTPPVARMVIGTDDNVARTKINATSTRARKRKRSGVNQVVEEAGFESGSVHLVDEGDGVLVGVVLVTVGD